MFREASASANLIWMMIPHRCAQRSIASWAVAVLPLHLSSRSLAGGPRLFDIGGGGPAHPTSDLYQRPCNSSFPLCQHSPGPTAPGSVHPVSSLRMDSLLLKAYTLAGSCVNGNLPHSMAGHLQTSIEAWRKAALPVEMRLAEFQKRKGWWALRCVLKSPVAWGRPGYSASSQGLPRSLWLESL